MASIKIDKVYTRSGDDGTTGLVGGSRVSKTDLRIQTIGVGGPASFSYWWTDKDGWADVQLGVAFTGNPEATGYNATLLLVATRILVAKSTTRTTTRTRSTL